jgi:ring-1,2-phenylacetyl-CoA epoxidase subunit PaaD
VVRSIVSNDLSTHREGITVQPGTDPLRQTRARTAANVWTALGGVPDPEVPAVSIVELGIARGVAVHDGNVVVTVTPTYSGCPATDMIAENIRAALAPLDFDRVDIVTVLSPAWTTDWIAPEAKEKLRAFGIAPPTGKASVIDVSGISPLRRAKAAVACPHCGSMRTRLVAQFGSTACKAQYRCEECLEPFDYFKEH